MEIPPAEIIDRMTIAQLKIERLNERHVSKEYDAYKKAIEKFKDKGIEIKQEWIDTLHAINSRIWDLGAKEREIAHDIFETNANEEENDEVLKEIGKRFIKVGKLMKERVDIKNKIARETGKGFEEIKLNHSAE